jgi:hypothetical protein
MVLKGVLSVSLYVSALLLANHVSAPQSGIDASVGLVSSGGVAEVKIAAAPCQPVSIRIEIGSYSQTVPLEHVPGSVFLNIPPETELRGYKITITCANERVVLEGIVV